MNTQMSVTDFIVTCGTRQTIKYFKKGDTNYVGFVSGYNSETKIGEVVANFLGNYKIGYDFSGNQQYFYQGSYQDAVKKLENQGFVVNEPNQKFPVSEVYQVINKTGYYIYNAPCGYCYLSESEFLGITLPSNTWQDDQYIYCVKDQNSLSMFPLSEIGKPQIVSRETYTGWGGGDRIRVEEDHYHVTLNSDMTVTRNYFDSTASVVGKKSFIWS
jgi:hypothetical protein